MQPRMLQTISESNYYVPKLKTPESLGTPGCGSLEEDYSIRNPTSGSRDRKKYSKGTTSTLDQEEEPRRFKGLSFNQMCMEEAPRPEGCRVNFGSLFSSSAAKSEDAETKSAKITNTEAKFTKKRTRSAVDCIRDTLRELAEDAPRKFKKSSDQATQEEIGSLQPQRRPWYEEQPEFNSKNSKKEAKNSLKKDISKNVDSEEDYLDSAIPQIPDEIQDNSEKLVTPIPKNLLEINQSREKHSPKSEERDYKFIKDKRLDNWLSSLGINSSFGFAKKPLIVKPEDQLPARKKSRKEKKDKERRKKSTKGKESGYRRYDANFPIRNFERDMRMYVAF